MNQEISQKLQPSGKDPISALVISGTIKRFMNYENIISNRTPKFTLKNDFLYSRLLNKLNTIRDLPKNWDSYDANVISEDAMETAIKTLNYLYNENQLSNEFSVTVFPMRDGGIQLEFDWISKEAELEINPDGDLTFIRFDDDGNMIGTPDRLYELSELSTVLEDLQYA